MLENKKKTIGVKICFLNKLLFTKSILKKLSQKIDFLHIPLFENFAPMSLSAF